MFHLVQETVKLKYKAQLLTINGNVICQCNSPLFIANKYKKTTK